MVTISGSEDGLIRDFVASGTERDTERRSSLAVSVVGKGQESPAAVAGADVSDDYDDDWDLEDVAGLDDVERVGAKCCLRDFQDCFCAMKRKVPGIVAEVFEVATESVNQKAAADAGSSTELVSMKTSLTTAPAKANKAQN